MNNSLIPMGGGPTNQDKAEMARLLQIMNGGDGAGRPSVPANVNPQQAHYSGGNGGRRPINETIQAPAYIPSFGTSREEVDAMKNIMEKLNHINGNELPTAQNPQPLTETIHFAHEYPEALPAAHNGPFTVLVQIVESNGKEVNRYNVVDARRQDVVQDLIMKESATAIMKLMNKGNSITSVKVKEVIELEEEFNRNRLETARHKQRYQRAAELGETAAANVFKERFNVAKANAMIAQDTIKSINESLR